MKKTLSVAELEAQTALELPNRDLMHLIEIEITNVLNNNVVTINVPINVAANLCAQLIATGNFECQPVADVDA